MAVEIREVGEAGVEGDLHDRPVGVGKELGGAAEFEFDHIFDEALAGGGAEIVAEGRRGQASPGGGLLKRDGQFLFKAAVDEAQDPVQPFVGSRGRRGGRRERELAARLLRETAEQGREGEKALPPRELRQAAQIRRNAPRRLLRKMQPADAASSSMRLSGSNSGSVRKAPSRNPA